MPQGPPELHEKFGDDETAWKVLEPNYIRRHGIISPKSASYEETPEDSQAISYLIREWDYGYEL